MNVRAVEPRDRRAWEDMRQRLWPSAPGEHAGEISAFFGGARDHLLECLVAIGDDGEPIGFAEVSIRPYAEGCESRRVAYLEGWFVGPAYRRTGVGAALVAAAETWARAEGCTEFASDTDLDNHQSALAHQALGFTEVARQICFAKTL